MLAILNNIFLVAILASGAEKFSCSEGTITKTAFEKISSESAGICYNNDKTALVSKNCLERKCSVFQNPARYSISEFMGDIGKPGFKLCRKIGGKPELIEFSIEKKFYKLDRCLFPDGNFSDTSLLLSFYLN